MTEEPNADQIGAEAQAFLADQAGDISMETTVGIFTDYLRASGITPGVIDSAGQVYISAALISFLMSNTHNMVDEVDNADIHTGFAIANKVVNSAFDITLKFITTE